MLQGADFGGVTRRERWNTGFVSTAKRIPIWKAFSFHEGLVNVAPLITHVAGIHEYADLMKRIIAGEPGYIKGVIKLEAN